MNEQEKLWLKDFTRELMESYARVLIDYNFNYPKDSNFTYCDKNLFTMVK